MSQSVSEGLKETPLAGLHRELGARMVPFAGYSMPVQYPTGIIAEHNQVRDSAGLFDVSHMGQARLVGPDHETTARALEALTPGDFVGLGRGRERYTLLLSENGGIIDDLMVTRPASPDDDGRLLVVVNAARKDVDYADFRARLPASVILEPMDDRALLALQGPAAAAVLSRHVPDLGEPGFMTAWSATFDDLACGMSRSGYTGEDGFELSMAADDAEAIARALLAEPEVGPIGLGARDSLRLEAGLCLYGHDIDTMTTPVEADLEFAIARRRREEGGFPGAARIQRELQAGPPRKRVGLTLDGKAPAREGAPIKTVEGRHIGDVTSGGFGPTVGAPIAMGYVDASYAEPGTRIAVEVRGRDLPATVSTMPFVPHRYFRKRKP
ncbi:MAG: glycine cleavage system aminomethyltransferase GcvT [Bauldia sp.]|uniref:glycine cleavage system aminomethyltransferase GcvT n=1 Tax=Bauldia sp. TaxID=2575872 RepID=UPI001D7E93E7|nr:glycine cleavage system aminomethyltransferase GcvT [Bauldia sp.]MCB1497548.1 glycine cleavage system aminomethyltransferase GcvT [Bauldia sp.]